MNERDHKRNATQPAEPGWFHGSRAWLVSGVVVAVVLFLSYKWATTPDETDRKASPAAKRPAVEPDDDEDDDPHMENPHGAGHAPWKSAAARSEPEDFLSEFNKKDGDAAKEAGPALSDDELERHFNALLAIDEKLASLKDRAARGVISGGPEMKQALADRKSLLKQWNRQADALKTEVGQALRARPGTAVPRWLAGELLVLVGGEPEEVMPHLKYAGEYGLQRPRLAGSLARAQLEGNQFAESLATATAALDQDPRNRYLWDAYARAAISNHQFEPVIARLLRTFSTGLPSWAEAHRSEAAALLAKWEIELQRRKAEAIADDLPRVRLVIEHRRFGKDNSVETTGRGEVVIELFENEAPLTVANFIDLVAQKFYDGTTFYKALPASIVVGGDPNTKKDDRADDGLGGPGYVIADEYQLPGARHIFRGAVSMVKTNPRTAGSQFFFSLAPDLAMDGHFTVFGRVLQGQDVVDRITRGRTHKDVGHIGRLIPGDLLVRAEVVRKRSHEYRAVKLQP
jgi:peptidyl-prolyl cis-trans isomerase B (cyclophilin B)